MNSNKTCWTYKCKYRLSQNVRCQATAKVIKFDGKWILQASDEKHTCEPNRVKIVAERLRFRMKDLVREDPVKPVSFAVRKVKIEAAEMFAEDEDFYQHLLSELGHDSALESQMLRVRYEIIGETPRSGTFVNPMSTKKYILSNLTIYIHFLTECRRTHSNVPA